jgi:hypothetical protein
VFQLLDLGAYGRLRAKQFTSSLGKAAEFGYFYESDELVKVHMDFCRCVYFTALVLQAKEKRAGGPARCLLEPPSSGGNE